MPYRTFTINDLITNCTYTLTAIGIEFNYSIGATWYRQSLTRAELCSMLLHKIGCIDKVEGELMYVKEIVTTVNYNGDFKQTSCLVQVHLHNLMADEPFCQLLTTLVEERRVQMEGNFSDSTMNIIRDQLRLVKDGFRKMVSGKVAMGW